MIQMAGIPGDDLQSRRPPRSAHHCITRWGGRSLLAAMIVMAFSAGARAQVLGRGILSDKLVTCAPSDHLDAEDHRLPLMAYTEFRPFKTPRNLGRAASGMHAEDFVTEACSVQITVP